jgi:hypothetical protein
MADMTQSKELEQISSAMPEGHPPAQRTRLSGDVEDMPVGPYCKLL